MDVAEFLWREAALLDDGSLKDWFDLFTEDCRYWIPMEDGRDPRTEMSIALDDRATLEDRVGRLQDPATHSQNPPSSTSRVVGNVLITARSAEFCTVQSSFVLTENRLGITRTFAGRYRHELVPFEDSWRIREKTVFIVNRRDPLPTVTFVW